MALFLALASASIGSLGEKLKGRFKQRQGPGRKEGFSDKDIKFLNHELRSMRAALSMVGEQQTDRLDYETKIWARDLRVLFYNTEDLLDSCLVLEEVRHRSQGNGVVGKMANNPIFKGDKSREQIASDIRGLKKSIDEITRRRHKCRLDGLDAPSASVMPIDPRLLPMYESSQLIDIGEARDEIIRRLTEVDGVPYLQSKIVSLVGLPGVGKTALAREVDHQIRKKFHYGGVFVSVSTNPNIKSILLNMLYQLGRRDSVDPINSWGQTQLIQKIQEILRDKRYLIVLDDIWDTESWTTLKQVVVNNNHECIIITTTRKVDVAEEIGGTYKVKPLSHESSKRLFYKRIYGRIECTSSREDEIVDKFVKKFGGLPLAIIGFSSLLAGKRIEHWDEQYNAIFLGEQLFLRQDSAYRNLIRVLSLSYYNLPSRLKSCLLYVRLFPEDYMIRRDRLVWMWIAEGFIQGKQRCHLFELGQSYIDELLNNSMIQEVDINDGNDDAMVKYCCVPKIVLLLISYMSREENFVTVVDDDRLRELHEKVRRISFQNVPSGELRDVATSKMYLSQVRSVTVFGPVGNNLMLRLLCCKVLRVLDLEGSDLQRYNLKNLGMLLHLRYLGLRGTLIDLVPEEIGNLLMLQVLDLKGTRIKELPSTVSQLRQLLCMYVECTSKLPQGMGQLTSLEELSKISITDSPAFANEVASLVELRVLGIVLQQDLEEGSQKGFLDSLCSLEKLKTLRFFGCSDSDLDFLSKAWVPPPALRTFITIGGWFSVLPTWIPSVNLSELHIGVRELWQKGLQALGRLQELRVLQLTVECMMERLEVDAYAFPRLRFLSLRSQTCLVFRQGAMAALRTLEFSLDMDKADSQFDWGLPNLTLLEHVTFTLCCANASAEEVLEAEAAMKMAASNHPNHPTLQITKVPSQKQEEQQENSSAGTSEIAA